MKITNVVVLAAIIIFTATVFAEEPRVYTDYDLRKYGATTSPSDDMSSKDCKIENYNTYENVTRIISSPGRVTIHDATIPGGAMTGTITSPSVHKDKETCMSLTIRNASDTMKRIDTNEITVTTIKGNVVRPYNGKADYVPPGKSLKVSNLCFHSVISGISEISVGCD